jgi:O-antigen/teichoic acid export membrane protein
MGGAVAGQLAMLLVLPVLTRLYSPRDFGVFAVFASLVGIVAVVACLRFEVAIPLQKTRRNAHCMMFVAFLSLLAVTAVLSLASFSTLACPGLAQILPLAVLGTLAVFVLGSINIITLLAVREHRYPIIARGKLVQGVSTALMSVGAAHFLPASLGLPVAFVVGAVLGLCAILLTFDFRVVELPSIREISEITLLNRKFPLFTAPSSLVNSLGVEMPPVLLSALFGPVVTGQYSLAQRSLFSPLAVLTKSWSHLYVGELSEAIRDQEPLLQKIYRNHSVKLLTITLPAIAVVSLAAPEIFEYVFGVEWKLAGDYVRLLSPLAIAYAVVVPLSQSLVLIGAQHLQLLWDIARLAGVVFAISLPFLMELSPNWSIGCLSLVGTLLFIAHAAVSYKAIADRSTNMIAENTSRNL